MCNGLSRIKLNELVTLGLDDNIKGTRGHFGNLLNFGVHGTAVSIFLQESNHQMESAGSAGSWCFQHQCVQGVPKQN